MDISGKVVNPYDYTREVIDPKLFAGRKEELAALEEDITRLVSAVSITPMVAIVGERRVGKTSLLVKLEKMCSKYGLLPARFPLLHTTAVDAWEFWREVFDRVILVAVQGGLIAQATDSPQFGFLQRVSEERQEARKYRDLLQFPQVYFERSTLNLPIPPSHILQDDLKVLLQAARAGNYKGIALIIDEAHLLLESAEITQQLRYTVQSAGNCGVFFAGEPQLAQMFTNVRQPLYAQARVVQLENFVHAGDVAECALQPLDDRERQLISPMTIDYLARLSQGKPNQIRLICYNIYKRYMRGEQKDLNITMTVLDDIVETIASQYTEYDLRKQVENMRRLGSVDLEAIYDMARYPDWSLQDVVDLDESFRGEAKSNFSLTRRERVLKEKAAKFINMGLMSEQRGKYVLVGGEFIYLYLRFLYEVRKYGQLSKKLVLGKGPPTPFREKTDKLVSSLSLELKRGPGIEVFIFHRQDIGVDDVINNVKRRFSILNSLLEGRSRPEKDLENILQRVFSICELVNKPGDYHLLCLSVRNLENPREAIQIELYFDSGETPLTVPLSALALIRRQADDAKILIEAFEDWIVRLPDLPSLLRAVGAPKLDDIAGRLDLVGRWRLLSIQHVIKGSETPDALTKQNNDEDKPDDWVELYAKGDKEPAEDLLTRKLVESPEQHKSARLYNDRGYIRYGLGKADLARRDLQMALDLHYENLPLTLLNLCVIDMDEDQWNPAIEKIDNALLLTLGREDISPAFLRLRFPSNHLNLGMKEKWEQNPANVLDASYINLAYVLSQSGKINEAVDTLQEGLSLVPSSVRLRHALARLHLFRKRADLAHPIYEELSQMNISDQELVQEVRKYLGYVRRGKKSHTKSK